MQFFDKLERRSRDGQTDDRLVSRIMLADPSSKITYLIDTGADVCVLPKTKFPQHKIKTTEPIDQGNLNLYAANNTKIKTYGTKLLKLDLNLRRIFPWRFIIADVSQPIIGVDFLKNF